MALRAVACGLALSSATTVAAQAIDDPDVRTLSSADRDGALRTGMDRASAEPSIAGPPGRIHGEIGAGVDSRGGHALFGATRVPLGDRAVADFSFSRVDGGRLPR